MNVWLKRERSSINRVHAQIWTSCKIQPSGAEVVTQSDVYRDSVIFRIDKRHRPVVCQADITRSTSRVASATVCRSRERMKTETARRSGEVGREGIYCRSLRLYDTRPERIILMQTGIHK